MRDEMTAESVSSTTVDPARISASGEEGHEGKGTGKEESADRKVLTAVIEKRQRSAARGGGWVTRGRKSG